MAELKFCCPHCGQHIQCEDAWSGHQIQCPACHGALTVPARPAAAPSAPAPAPAYAAAPPPPPPPPSSMLSTRPPAPARPPSAPAPAPGPIRRPLPPPAEKKGRGKQLAVVCVAIIGVAVGGYFGFGVVTNWQNKANEKRREVEKNSDGGEMGHIANLYDVLDATEPGGRGLGGRSRPTGPRQRQAGASRSIAVADDEDKLPQEKALPLLPATWTLEVESAQIPEGQANGTVSGTNFVVQTARVDAVGTSQVLRLMQGPLTSPERELLVYLHPKAGETIAGHSWNISKAMKGPEVPQVAKRWKPNPKYAPELKSFATGYAMKLELGAVTNGAIPGKIFLALPDTEQTVVAGLFKVPIRVKLWDDFSSE